jgi:iron complex outermembrane recepter protein
VEIKADKTVFNVDGTPNSTGLNALELLRRAPGVTVDNNDRIAVKGKQGIVVYIDDKPSPLDATSLADMLKNLQSDQVESIEIITNPSARYDAAGNAGIINIRLKKNKSFGTNGSVNLGYGTQRYSKYNTGISINRRTERWNLFGNYGNNWGDNWHWMNFYRVQNGISFDQSTSSVFGGLKHNFKAGADYTINKRHSVGVMTNGNLGEQIGRTLSRTYISSSGQDAADSVLIASSFRDGRRDNYNFNVNYQYRDTSDRVLTADLDYGDFLITTDNLQPNTYYDTNEEVTLNRNDFRNDTRTHITIRSGKADYEQPLFKGKLTAGIKIAQVRTSNDLNFFTVTDTEQLIDSLRSNEFNYTETIRAGYLNFSRQFGKWGIQAGVRVEQTVSDGRLTAFSEQNNAQVSRDYIDPFPSAALSWSMNEKNSFSLTYSRRIDRPSYQDLNPFEYRMDELSYRRGNEFLQPQYTNVVELSHTFKYMLNTSLTASRTSGFFTEITDTTETSRSYIQPRNLGYQDYIALNIGSPIPIKKWWNAYTNITLYQLYNNATFEDGKEVSLRINSFNFYMQNTFQLNPTTSFELSGWLNGPGVWGGTFKNRKMGGVDAAVKKTFLGDRAILRVAYGDLFNTMNWRGISEFGGLYIDARGGWESQTLRVSFTWKFGNQSVKVKERKAGAEDLNKRVGQ